MNDRLYTFKAPPELIAEFDRLVAAGNRSHGIRVLLEKAVKQAKERKEAK